MHICCNAGRLRSAPLCAALRHHAPGRAQPRPGQVFARNGNNKMNAPAGFGSGQRAAGSGQRAAGSPLAVVVHGPGQASPVSQSVSWLVGRPRTVSRPISRELAGVMGAAELLVVTTRPAHAHAHARGGGKGGALAPR